MAPLPRHRTDGRRMRALVVAVGSGGDIAPLAAVAAQLSRHGLQTTLMAPARYAGLAAAGVAFQSVGADAEFDAVFDDPKVWTARHGLARSWQYYGAAALTSLQQIERDWSPEDTVLVASSFAVGARMAARRLGFLDTTVHLSPGVLFSYARPPRWPAASIPPGWPPLLQATAAALAERLAIDPVIRHALRPAWRAAGLPREGRLFSRFIHSPHRVAYLFPEWLATAADDWPASGRHAGFARPAALVRAMAPEVRGFVAAGGAPLALITAGTAVAQRPGWVTRSAKALADAGHRVLVLSPTARCIEPAHGGRTLYAPAAPLAELLSDAAVLVHHGGVGTAADALRAGVPQWLFPGAHDQADNAQRLQQLGVARVFRPQARDAELQKAAEALPHDRAAPALARLRARLATETDGAERLAGWVAADARALSDDGLESVFAVRNASPWARPESPGVAMGSQPG